MDNTSRKQYNAGNGFSSAFILASGNITYNTCSTGYNGWKEQCQWIIQNGKRVGEIVLRLYWPSQSEPCPNGGCAMAGDPGQALGTAFYNEIVQPAIDQFNIRNLQVLNELNIEYEPNCKPRQLLAGDMFNIAWWIKHLAVQNGRGNVYLGFPGPGGNAADPVLHAADWDAYWNSYSQSITMATDQGPAYNWLAVHTYQLGQPRLTDRMRKQYDSLITKFPNYPTRWTEYGIPLDKYCTLPCADPSKFQSRANDCRTAILNFKSYVDTHNPPGPDVYSVFYYIAFNSNAGAQAGQETRYELVLNNQAANLGPAQTLANAF